MSTIHLDATVGTDGSVVVNSPDLTPGAKVRVTFVEDNSSEKKESLLSILGSCRGTWGTDEEVEAYVNGLRGEWEG